jgi:hypothetical protein
MPQASVHMTTRSTVKKGHIEGGLILIFKKQLYKRHGQSSLINVGLKFVLLISRVGVVPGRKNNRQESKKKQLQFFFKRLIFLAVLFVLPKRPKLPIGYLSSKALYWNVLTDWIFCTGIFLLTGICTGIFLLTGYFVLEYSY